MNAEEFQWSACLEQIVAWYAGNRRVLPWREDAQPYRVWVSEIMLQQTRIEAVIPYYRRFLAALPTVADLAAVEDEKLMKLWEGLGYYSRARNLKKAAQRILTDFGGQLPSTAEELKSLPGIGDYTAGAIASIAFGQPEPAVDGNVLRVMTRLLAWDADVASPKTKAEMVRLLRQHYPAGEAAGLLTEGIMELGETLCIPNGQAHCEQCPVHRFCRARLSDRVERYPVKAPKKERRIEERSVLLLHCGGRYAIRRRPPAGLLAGLWEYPGVDGFLSPEALSSLLADWGLRVRELQPLGRARHVFTHVEWHMEGYLVQCEAPGGDFVWLPGGEIRKRYSIPTAFRFLTARLETEAPPAVE